MSVTFVSCVKTNKHIFKKFSPSGSQAILVFRTKRHGNIQMETPLTEASNADGVGRNRNFEPICLLLTLQQAKCCQHGHWWNTATISQVVTLILLVVLRVFDHQAPCAIKSPALWFHRARVTKRALALYTITINRVYDSKA